jgi:hypothetical protein
VLPTRTPGDRKRSIVLGKGEEQPYSVPPYLRTVILSHIISTQPVTTQLIRSPPSTSIRFVSSHPSPYQQPTFLSTIFYFKTILSSLLTLSTILGRRGRIRLLSSRTLFSPPRPSLQRPKAPRQPFSSEIFGGEASRQDHPPRLTRADALSNAKHQRFLFP